MHSPVPLKLSLGDRQLPKQKLSNLLHLGCTTRADAVSDRRRAVTTDDGLTPGTLHDERQEGQDVLGSHGITPRLRDWRLTGKYRNAGFWPKTGSAENNSTYCIGKRPRVMGVLP